MAMSGRFLCAVFALLGLTYGFLVSDSKDVITFQLSVSNGVHRQIHRVDSATDLLKSGFDPSLKTYFLIHGWLAGKYQPLSKYLSTDKILRPLLNHEKCNVFEVDWSGWAISLNYPLNTYRVKVVGKRTAEFIELLEKLKGGDRQKMHLIGHSLGGQIAGFTGMNLQSPKVARITGLDTADLGFNCNNPQDCLDPSDADFVDEIHTSMSFKNKGHADFFPAEMKRRADLKFGLSVVDDHMTVVDYFAASIEAGACAFKGRKCSSETLYKNGRCNTEEVNHMGYYATKPKLSPPNNYYLYAHVKIPCN